MSYDEAVEHAILTFRDADGVGWIRMPGAFSKSRNAILRAKASSSQRALGRPLPEPTEPAAAAGSAGEAEKPEASAAQ